MRRAFLLVQLVLIISLIIGSSISAFAQSSGDSVDTELQAKSRGSNGRMDSFNHQYRSDRPTQTRHCRYEPTHNANGDWAGDRDASIYPNTGAYWEESDGRGHADVHTVSELGDDEVTGTIDCHR